MASRTIYGCVEVDGTITFKEERIFAINSGVEGACRSSYLFGDCISQRAYIPRNGLHAYQVALEITGADNEGCNDTFYGCINWDTKKFQVEIPSVCCNRIYTGRQEIKSEWVLHGCDMSSGKILWGVPAASINRPWNDVWPHVAQDSNGNLYVTTLYIGNDVTPYAKAQVGKYDENGILLWAYNAYVGYSTRPVGWGIVLDSTYYVYVTLNKTVSSPTVIKLNADDGTLVWGYDTPTNATGIDIKSDGSIIYVTGRWDAVSEKSIWAIDENGNLIWSSNTDCNLNAIVCTGNALYVAGIHMKVYINDVLVDSYSMWKFDLDGNKIWDYDTGGATYGVCASPDGSIIYIVGARIEEASVWALNTSGVLLWSYDTGSSAYCVDVDSSGNIYVGGVENASGDAMWKLDSTGDLVWSSSHYSIYYSTTVLTGLTVSEF